MSAKVIFINPIGQEFTIATFKGEIEAYQAAALFNAILHPDSKAEYRVLHKHRGTLVNRAPDPLRNTVSNITTLRDHLKPIF